MQQLLIIGAIVAAFFFLRWLKRQPRKTRLQWLLIAIAAILIGLALTGRLNWIIAAGAATLPFLAKLFALLRFAPLLVRLMHGVRFGKQNYSNFRSDSLVIEVNPLTGTADGKILVGQFAGRRLNTLSQEELQTLAEQFARDDPPAAALLKSYFEMRQGGASQRTREQAPAQSDMTTDEAHQVLGLSPGCSEAEITAAYRRLIQRLHPDQGGTPHLAAMINQARQCLLRDKAQK